MPQRQAYPVEIPRENLAPVNDNNFGAGRCPVCNGLASIARRTSEYQGK
jgi:hypothetical protein